MVTGAGADASKASLARSLEPVLHEQCEGCLGKVRWFRTDWQRGGAATGYAIWTSGEDSHDVVVKLPVVQRELQWLQQLGTDGAVVPRLHAGGESLGGYDLAWVVIERLPTGPLGTRWADGHVDRMADAAARFTASADIPCDEQSARREDWEHTIGEARESIQRNHVEEAGHWKKSLVRVGRHLDELMEQWRARPLREWLHGDLHLANAMSRSDAPDSDVVLIDLAEVHVGHWVEDAVYLERQLWGHPTRLKETRPVRAMAAARRRHELAVDDGDAKLADLRRLLLAATAPAFMRSEGDPRYLRACLLQLDAAAERLKVP